ncbi:MAG: DUF362 domain-containing protein [Sedimentisphaerales bacterium]
MKTRTVIVRRCETYDASIIEEIIREGIEELKENPSGKILIKPNVVCSTPVVQSAHTHTSVVEATVNALRRMKAGDEISIGESGGMAIPTRLFFHHAGYSRMARRLGVPLRDFNEERWARVRLTRAKWHKTVFVAKSLYEANYKIWVPKLKFHNACQITNAIKLNVGILTHKERMLYHDDRLEEKIVDLLEVGYPNLIVSDAIEIGHGSEFAPYPYHLGAILIANDPLAIDMVAARILNYQPEDVGYLGEARDRGYGTLDWRDIEIKGDVSIDELSDKTRKIETPYSVNWDVQKVKSPVKFYPGINPESGRRCVGGCLNALAGSLATSELYYPGLVAGLESMGIVIGYYKGDVVHPGEKVALIGSCAGVEGKLVAGKIIRIKGCPVKGMDQAAFLFPRLGIRTPAWKLSNVFGMVYHSIVKGLMLMARPFRKRVGEPGVPGLRRA